MTGHLSDRPGGRSGAAFLSRTCGAAADRPLRVRRAAAAHSAQRAHAFGVARRMPAGARAADGRAGTTCSMGPRGRAHAAALAQERGQQRQRHAHAGEVLAQPPARAACQAQASLAVGDERQPARRERAGDEQQRVALHPRPRAVAQRALDPPPAWRATARGSQRHVQPASRSRSPRSTSSRYVPKRSSNPPAATPRRGGRARPPRRRRTPRPARRSGRRRVRSARAARTRRRAGARRRRRTAASGPRGRRASSPRPPPGARGERRAARSSQSGASTMSVLTRATASARGRGDARVRRAREAAVGAAGEHADRREALGEERRRAVRRAVVDDEHLGRRAASAPRPSRARRAASAHR